MHTMGWRNLVGTPDGWPPRPPRPGDVSSSLITSPWNWNCRGRKERTWGYLLHPDNIPWNWNCWGQEGEEKGTIPWVRMPLLHQYSRHSSNFEFNGKHIVLLAYIRISIRICGFVYDKPLIIVGAIVVTHEHIKRTLFKGLHGRLFPEYWSALLLWGLLGYYDWIKISLNHL